MFLKITQEIITDSSFLPHSIEGKQWEVKMLGVVSAGGFAATYTQDTQALQCKDSRQWLTLQVKQP